MTGKKKPKNDYEYESDEEDNERDKKNQARKKQIAEAMAAASSRDGGKELQQARESIKLENKGPTKPPPKVRPTPPQSSQSRDQPSYEDWYS
jgi:hypothetical protein